MRQVRIRDIEKAYGIGRSTIVAHLKKKGNAVQGDITDNTIVTTEQLELIDRKFRTLRRVNLLKEEEPRKSKVKPNTSESQKLYDKQYAQIVAQQADFERHFLKKIIIDSQLMDSIENRYLLILKKRFDLELIVNRFSDYVRRHSSPELKSALNIVSGLNEDSQKVYYNEFFQKRFLKESRKFFNKYHRYLSPSFEDIEEDSNLVNKSLDLSWETIRFRDGYLEFLYSGKLYSIATPGAKEAFNILRPSFVKKIPFLKVRINGNNVVVDDSNFIQNVIILLGLKNSVFHVTDINEHRFQWTKFNRVPKELIQAFFPIDKSQYFDYLQFHQDGSINIVPVFEHDKQNPDGFLFTVKTSSGWSVIWESCSQEVHKATYIFDIKDEELNCFLQLLFDYIFSGTPRKRESLRRKAVQEFLGIDYTIIDHVDFDVWKRKVESLIVSPKRSCPGVLKKSEAIVSYSVDEQEHSYEPVHNIMQNGLKKWLELSGSYSDVVLEENNIDVKATKNTGEVYLFEVKTTSPKMCIRQALGQILEYAHFKQSKPFQKLYIVGPDIPNKEEKAYMQLLRDMYHIPVWYCGFDPVGKTLSIEY